MSDQGNTTTIRKVVAKARSRGRIPEDQDMLVYQLCIDGMKDLSLFKLPHQKNVKLEMDSLGRIYMPSDYLMFLGVGIPYNGRLYTFTRDKSLVRTSDKTYTYEAYDADYGETKEPSDTYYYQYGQGGGVNETYFTINERGGYIHLVGFDGTTATLSYVSSGIDESPDGVVIPKIAEEALIAYILWMYIQYDVNMPVGEKRERERLYMDRCDDLDMIYAPTMDEIMDNYYKNTYATIKRV